MKKIIYILLNFICWFLPRKRAVILLYHSIDDNDVYLTVSPENFSRQMKYLKENKYNVISLDELSDVLKNKGEIKSKTVVLTFDDGFKSHFKNAVPVLKKYDFPAVFFISPDYLGQEINNSENKPQLVMNEAEVRELEQEKLFDIQPHALSHQELTKLPLPEATKEIISSKEKLENLLNKKCRHFAFPRGAFNQDIIEAVKQADLDTAVSVKEGVVSQKADVYALPRNTINSRTSMIEFKGKLNQASGIFNIFR